MNRRGFKLTESDKRIQQLLFPDLLGETTNVHSIFLARTPCRIVVHPCGLVVVITFTALRELADGGDSQSVMLPSLKTELLSFALLDVSPTTSTGHSTP